MALYLYPNFFFYLFFSMTKYLVFNIFCMYFMFLCSIYVQNLQQVLYVFWKFCVPYCLVLFTFIFNLWVTNESMCIVMMIGKNNLGKFCRFSCVIFCSQNASIPLNHILLQTSIHSFITHFLSIIFIEPIF